MRNTPLFQRVYGCLIGGAVGDAMGFPTEGMHYSAIKSKYGHIDRPLIREGGETWNPPVTSHLYTDDTVMKHMLCDAIFEAGGHPSIEQVAAVWRRTITDHSSWVWWLNTRVVASKLQWNPLLPLRDVGRDSIPCNDAAMIMAPIGLINAGDPQRAALEAWDISALLQNDYSRECAAAMAAAFAEAIRPGATVDSIIRTAKQYGPTLAPYVTLAIDLVEQCGEAAEFTQIYYDQHLRFPNEEFWTPSSHPDKSWSFGADPLEVCTEALAFFALANGNAKEAILGAVNFGRDCDTIAGLAGSLCGALNGPQSIPSDWSLAISNANPETDIAEYANRLCLVIQKHMSVLDNQLKTIGMMMQ